jgi:long-chain acyl-CoA synthetase
MIGHRIETLSPDDAVETTLPQILKRRAEQHPDALAFREKIRGIWQRTSWSTYYTQMQHFALGLQALGFASGDRLAIASENTPEWMIADLATQALGGACLGVYPTSPWPELHYILRHSKARFVVCGDQEQTDKVIDALAGQGGLPDLRKIVCVDMKGMRHYQRDDLVSFADVVALGAEQAGAGSHAIAQLIAKIQPDDVAIIVYTSGTTGMPKGAMLTHRNMLYSGSQVVRILGLSADTYSTVCYLPLCHVAERSFAMVMQLICGSTVSFAESVDTVAVNLREIAPRGFLGVPRIWEKLQHGILIRVRDATRLQRWAFETCMHLGGPIADRALAHGGRLQGFRDRALYGVLWLICFRAVLCHIGLNRAGNCFCGGATVSPEVLRFFRIIGVPVYQIYGMTESAGVTHMQRPGHTSIGCSGTAIDGLGERLGPDGELLVRAPSVFKGYLFDDAATARTIEDDWLHTGDIAEYEPAGEIRIVDRKKDIIITSGGKNITPSLIENALKDSFYIREAILLGEGRHFLSALIQIDYDTVGKWAQENGLPYTTYRSLAEHQAVRDLIAREIETVNARFARVENVRKFVILTKELDHDDGELTATMKIRRRVIETRFREEIEFIYGSAA